MTYRDWIENGNDAWVSAMAAPVSIATIGASPVALSERPLVETALARRRLGTNGKTSTVERWTPDQAYLHSVVMGNDGKLLRRLIDTQSIDSVLDRVLLQEPSRSIKDGAKHLVIFAHGGLNSEATAINRTMLLGPWFKANGIHPIFLNWRTSVLEAIGNIGQDITGEFLKQREKLSEGVIGDLLSGTRDKLQNQFDKAFEASAEKFIGKAIWSQMKQNAQAAANRSGGTRQMLQHLRKLRKKHPELKIHMLGHSAGSILLGQMANDLKPDDGLDSVGLFAPACTMQFAVRHYGKLLKTGILKPQRMFIDNLNDELERDDTVGPYGKSLLYLVSRALEETRNVPLLGLERAWRLEHGRVVSDPAATELPALKEELKFDFDELHIKHIRDWSALAHEYAVRFEFHEKPQSITREKKNDMVEKIDRTHSSFDNDIEIMNASLWRILGHVPKQPIDDLTGF